MGELPPAFIYWDLRQD